MSTEFIFIMSNLMNLCKKPLASKIIYTSLLSKQFSWCYSIHGRSCQFHKANRSFQARKDPPKVAHFSRICSCGQHAKAEPECTHRSSSRKWKNNLPHKAYTASLSELVLNLDKHEQNLQTSHTGHTEQTSIQDKHHEKEENNSVSVHIEENNTVSPHMANLEANWTLVTEYSMEESTPVLETEYLMEDFAPVSMYAPSSSVRHFHEDRMLEEEEELVDEEIVERISKVKKPPHKKLKKKKAPSVQEVMQYNMSQMKDVLPDVLKSKKLFQKAQRELMREKAIVEDLVITAENKATDLQCFVEVNVAIGAKHLRRAHSVVMAKYLNSQNSPAHRQREIEQLPTPSVYTTLMRAWAQKGTLPLVKELYSQLKTITAASDEQLKNVSAALSADQVALIDACVACLQCIGRGESSAEKTEFLHIIMADLKHQLPDLHSISRHVSLPQEEWKFVLAAIHQVEPDFSPAVFHYEQGYNCSLLNELNTTHESENPFHGALSPDDVREVIQQQMAAEFQDSVTVDSILPTEALTDKNRKAQEILQASEQKMRTALTNALNNMIQFERMVNRYKYSVTLLPYLEVFPVEDYVELMMQEIRELSSVQDIKHAELKQKLFSYFTPDRSILHVQLGKRLYRKFLVQHRLNMGYKKKMEEMYAEYLQAYNSEKLSGNHRQLWQDIIEKHGMRNMLRSCVTEWPTSTCRKLGKLLYNMILAEVRVDKNMFTSQPSNEVPAFHVIFRQRNDRMNEEILPHPTLVRLYWEAQSSKLTFLPADLPSLLPPMPWSDAASGGSMLSTGTALVRFPLSAKTQANKLQELPGTQLYPLLDAINAVSAVPWKINTPILDLVISVFNNGGDASLDIPESVSSLPPPPTISSYSSDPAEWKTLLREKLAHEKKHLEMYGLWCTELYRLSIANKYRDKVFWFSHNVDFRGRVYTIPPHISHLSGDLTRSMLMFAQGKPLGMHGLDWIKIHLINLSGLKKRSSNAERLEYANHLMPHILDSADNPFKGAQWWTKCDDKWQALACCREIAAALRHDGPAEEYVSHLPVQQDGSCNGLQHYAALGRDTAGAHSVNLAPSERPKDVYSDVVELVERDRKLEAAAGLEVAQMLSGFVRRKVIKQTIMTTVYGVTPYGAREQIQRQLEDIPDFPQEHTLEAAQYLAKKTFSCLSEMFYSTKQTQDWLVVLAELVAVLRLAPIEWQTPLGFPVIQPYFTRYNLHLTRQESSIFSATGRRKTQLLAKKINTRKQKNALPPNFIHSLDATHMMLTAINCLRLGKTFVSVHDSYWTHAADVDVMNKVCREQFLSLHSEPILTDLSSYIEEHFAAGLESIIDVGAAGAIGAGVGKERVSQEKAKNQRQELDKLMEHIVRSVPAKGDFELQKVLESTYFFS